MKGTKSYSVCRVLTCAASAAQALSLHHKRLRPHNVSLRHRHREGSVPSSQDVHHQVREIFFIFLLLDTKGKTHKRSLSDIK